MNGNSIKLLRNHIIHFNQLCKCFWRNVDATICHCAEVFIVLLSWKLYFSLLLITVHCN